MLVLGTHIYITADNQVSSPEAMLQQADVNIAKIKYFII